MPARCCRTEWGRPRSNSPSAASRGEEAAESPQPGHIALPAPVVSCREKGGVPLQVLALTEFAATIGARQLPFSAELGCWRDKQGGEGRHQFSLCPSNHALRDFPSIFGSLFFGGSPRGLAVLYLMIICCYFLIVALLLVSKPLPFLCTSAHIHNFWWKATG